MKKIISTSDAPAAIGPYSQAIRSGNFIFCSGQIPLDPKSGEMVADDIGAQTRRVLDNISGLLKAEGLSLGDVLKTTIFLTDLGNSLNCAGFGPAKRSENRNRSDRTHK